MKRRIHNPELIVKKLREADAVIASGGTIEQACKQLGISDATYYNWRKAVKKIKQQMDLSERRACKTISQPRMTQRNQLKEPDRDSDC